VPRLNDYLNTYMASLAYPAMYSQISRDITGIEDERRYIDGLIAQEQQNLRLLEQQLAVAPQDTATLKTLLVDFNRNRARQADLSTEQGRAAALAGGQLTDAQKRTVAEALAKPVSVAIDELKGLVPSLNPSQKETVLGLIDASDASGAAAIRTQVSQVASGDPAEVGGGEAMSTLQKEERALQQAITALGQAGRAGVFGQDRGQAEIDRRGAEGDALLEEYMSAVDNDGAATLEDFGGDAARLADAARIYDRAKATGAYRNDQRRFFEQSFLDSKARISVLRSQAEEIARPAGVTRQDEVMKRYWTARGYDFDAPYIAQQQEWYYKHLVEGDRLYESGLEASRRLFEEDPERFVVPQGYVVMLTPDNEAQTLARDYVAQRFANGDRTLSMGEARRQLKKVLSGQELDDALAFAHAYNRGLNQNVETPDDAEREMAQIRAATEQREQLQVSAREAQRKLEEAEELTQRMEDEQVAAVSGAREQLAQAPKAARDLYTRLRVSGMEREAINRAMNQGFEVLVNPSLEEDTRAELLSNLGFREADIPVLASAYGPQMRDRVRNASPLEIQGYSRNPYLKVFIDAPTLRAATMRTEEQRRRLVEGMEVGVSAPSEIEAPLPPVVAQEVTAPGSQTQNMPAVDPTEAILERNERSPDYLQRAAQTGQSPSPGIPANQSRGPQLTAAQRAVFEGLDDETLKGLADRSPFAAAELAARKPQVVAAKVQAPEAPPLVTDPSNDRYQYRALPAEGGFEIYEDGNRLDDALPGSRAFDSIQRVLSGGQPLPPRQQQPPPQPVRTYNVATGRLEP